MKPKSWQDFFRPIWISRTAINGSSVAGPWITRFRAEGVSLKESLKNGWRYVWKYIWKRPYASPELIEYFDQTRLAFQKHMRANQKSPVDLTLSFGGDLMWIRDHWKSYVGADLKKKFFESDGWIVNLESPIDRTNPVPVRAWDYLTYNSPPDLIDAFNSDSGKSCLSAVSFSNNHVLDRGLSGADQTLDFLRERKIPVSGFRQHADDPAFVVLEIQGKRIGFASFGWGVNGFDSLEGADRLNIIPGIAPAYDATRFNPSQLFAALKDMDRLKVDAKILALHWGHEFEYYPDALQVDLAHALVRAGADVIVGHHSHMVQPIERVVTEGLNGESREGLVLYSLGNFATAMFTPLCRVGMIAKIGFTWNQSGQLSVIAKDVAPVWNKFRLLFFPMRKLTLQPPRRIREWFSRQVWGTDSGFEA
jgi:hypothetical protein